MILLQLMFWASLGGVVYVYAVYPLVIWLCGRLFGRSSTAREMSGVSLPTLSVLIAAHNEEDVIQARIENLLALDYPPEKLQILIASDGSVDQTVAIARSFGPRVTVIDYPENRGKAATLNRSLNAATGEIVLLSDANTNIDTHAARRLASWFDDPGIGVVCGRLQIVDPQNGANVDGLYWRYETFLKRCENRLGALLGSNGAIYAIRRSLLLPIPEQAIVDDFVIPLRAKLMSHCRIVYDERALGFEQAAPGLRDEFKRRVRIGAGGFQAIAMLWRLLLPRQGWTAFAFLSHKVLRWCCPLLMLCAIATNALLWSHGSPFSELLLLQLAFYCAAVAMMRLPGSVAVPKLLRLPGMFLGMNLALLLGLMKWLTNTQRGRWERTQRV